MGGRDWATGWLDLLESATPHAARRRAQGRAYHRAGRVTDVRVRHGGLSARVQGTHAMPHAVDVTVDVLSDEAWERVVEVLAGQIRHSARLLAGQAPDVLDAELQTAGVRVFPTGDEVDTTCTCDDPAWPCAHVAAVWEAVAERMADDPFLLLRLRGRGRERLLAQLAAARRRRATAEQPAWGIAHADLQAEGWTRAREVLDDVGIPPPRTPRTPAGPLRVLGNPPGWQGGVGAWDLLRPAIEAASRWAREREVR